MVVAVVVVVVVVVVLGYPRVVFLSFSTLALRCNRLSSSLLFVERNIDIFMKGKAREIKRFLVAYDGDAANDSADPRYKNSLYESR